MKLGYVTFTLEGLSDLLQLYKQNVAIQVVEQNSLEGTVRIILEGEGLPAICGVAGMPMPVKLNYTGSFQGITLEIVPCEK